VRNWESKNTKNIDILNVWVRANSFNLIYCGDVGMLLSITKGTRGCTVITTGGGVPSTVCGRILLLRVAPGAILL
jgi:hypothetical protein